MAVCLSCSILRVPCYSFCCFSKKLLTRSIADWTDSSLSFALTLLSAAVAVVKCRPNKSPASVRVSPCSRAMNIPICLQSDTFPRLVPVDSSSTEKPDTLATASRIFLGDTFLTNFIVRIRWLVVTEVIHWMLFI